MSPGKVYNYFGEVSNNRAREITARKRINPSQIIVRRYIGRGKFVSIKFDNLDLIYWWVRSSSRRGEDGVKDVYVGCCSNSNNNSKSNVLKKKKNIY